MEAIRRRRLGGRRWHRESRELNDWLEGRGSDRLALFSLETNNTTQHTMDTIYTYIYI